MKKKNIRLVLTKEEYWWLYINIENKIWDEDTDL